MSKAILAFNSFFVPKGKITAFDLLGQWLGLGLPSCHWQLVRGGVWEDDTNGPPSCLYYMGSPWRLNDVNVKRCNGLTAVKYNWAFGFAVWAI
ncbi:hypothetical protein Tco_0343112 [Tanacetum coccineum]